MPGSRVQGWSRDLARALPTEQQSFPHRYSPELEINTVAITGLILEAITASKTDLMGCIDYLVSQCNLIRHDLDNIRGRLTTVEGCISKVEDASHSQGSQLSKLRDMVRSLQHHTEDRQRRNNVRVMGLQKEPHRSCLLNSFFKNLAFP